MGFNSGFKGLNTQRLLNESMYAESDGTRICEGKKIKCYVVIIAVSGS